MKISSYTFIPLIVGICFLSCSKKNEITSLPNPNITNPDSVPPVITLNGHLIDTIFLNSSWTDSGVTVIDAHDSILTAVSNSNSTNPNINYTGSYSITYIATDAAGNVDSATRIVVVINSAFMYAGTYTVSESTVGSPFHYSYQQILTPDSTINNRIHFNDFGNYFHNYYIIAEMLASGDLQIHNQIGLYLGMATGGPCTVCSHAFESTSFTPTPNGFMMDYIDEITEPHMCIGSSSHHINYVKQ